MAQTRRGTVQWGSQQRVGTVEVHDGVAAGDVEGKAAIELDAFGGQIRCDACVREEIGRLDHEPLVFRVQRPDQVGGVECVEPQ